MGCLEGSGVPVLYIGRAHHYTPNTPVYVFFSTNISTEFFKHAAHTFFFFSSSKCNLFHNATCFGSALFSLYIENVLKFKCQILVPKV
jgi:hypothetical protein